MHCPCCVWQGRFTPHPRPLSPVRGEGGLRVQSTLPVPSSTLPGPCESSILMHCPCCVWQGRFTPHPRPLSPVRREGGLRVQSTLPVPSSTLPGPCECSILMHCPCCVWQGRFTPHPRPLSPVRGEGGLMLFLQELHRWGRMLLPWAGFKRSESRGKIVIRSSIFSFAPDFADSRQSQRIRKLYETRQTPGECGCPLAIFWHDGSEFSMLSS